MGSGVEETEIMRTKAEQHLLPPSSFLLPLGIHSLPLHLLFPFYSSSYTMESSSTTADQVSRRALVLAAHLRGLHTPSGSSLSPSPCLHYSPPELACPSPDFSVSDMRKLMDGHNLPDRDWLYGLLIQSRLFNPRVSGGRVFVWPDYNQSMEQQREITLERISYLLDCGVFQGWLTDPGPEAELRKLALHEALTLFDHSLSVKLGVHYFLWHVCTFSRF